MEEFLKIAIPAITGLIAGALGSFIAPWVNWGIEKQKLRRAAKQELIAATRRLLETPPDKLFFRESAIYSQLRPFLSDAVRKIIEDDIVYVSLGGRGSGVNNYKTLVLDDINLLEKDWKLL